MNDQKSTLEKRENHPEGEATPQAPKTNPRRPLLQRFLGAVKQLGKDVMITNEKIPLEEINEQSVARIIFEGLGNPLQERINGDRYANPFDIVSVVTALGYVALSSFADYMKKYPDVYQETRKALWSLHQQGVLDQKDFDEPNAHGERTYYKVVDLDLLSKIAQGIQPPETQS